MDARLRRPAFRHPSHPGARPGRARLRRRFGIRQHFAVAPWTDLVEVHWSSGFEAYVTPVAPDVVGIGILGPRAHRLPRGSRNHCPNSRTGSTAQRPHRASAARGPLLQRTSARSAGRVLLVGDASGYVDALTGRGSASDSRRPRRRSTQCSPTASAGYGRDWAASLARLPRDHGLMVAAATSPLRRAIVPIASALPAAFGSHIERLAR